MGFNLTVNIANLENLDQGTIISRSLQLPFLNTEEVLKSIKLNTNDVTAPLNIEITIEDNFNCLPLQAYIENLQAVKKLSILDLKKIDMMTIRIIRMCDEEYQMFCAYNNAIKGNSSHFNFEEAIESYKKVTYYTKDKLPTIDDSWASNDEGTYYTKKDNNILIIKTTGLVDKHEILQLAILNGKGKIYYNYKFKPAHKDSLAKIEAITGIPSEMMKYQKAFSEVKNYIQALINSSDIIVSCYPSFDIEMLEQNGIYIPKRIKLVDLMKSFSEKIKQHNQTLIECANYYNYPKEKWHNAITDTRAALFCFQKMVNDETIDLNKY